MQNLQQQTLHAWKVQGYIRSLMLQMCTCFYYSCYAARPCVWAAMSKAAAALCEALPVW
jgi:hypothetical protein